MASLHMTHKNSFSPLHGSCLWKNDCQGLVVFMWPCPVNFSRRRGRGRGGGFFMTQDNLKPQLRACPFSPPPPPHISAALFNFVKRSHPFLYLVFMPWSPHFVAEQTIFSPNGQLSNESYPYVGLGPKKKKKSKIWQEMSSETVCRVIILVQLLIL